jgi:hypothetical protein
MDLILAKEFACSGDKRLGRETVEQPATRPYKTAMTAAMKWHEPDECMLTSSLNFDLTSSQANPCEANAQASK